jgi:hypothetical protein
MSELPDFSSIRQSRALIIWNNSKSPFIIYRENPLIDYFTDDERAEAVLIDSGKIMHIGSNEIDPEFIENVKDTKCSSISFKYRNCQEDDSILLKSFSIPLEEEIKIFIENFKNFRNVIMETLQAEIIASTEKRLAEKISAAAWENGYKIKNTPIVAFDGSTNHIWHKNDNRKIEKLGYIEAIAYKNGIPYIFSETVFIENGPFAQDYMEFIKAREFLVENFICGARTSYIYEKIGNFRHEKLYLTQPLFPYTNWVQMPGDDRYLEMRSTAVFDLWIKRENYVLRKKFTAISGYESAIVL